MTRRYKSIIRHANNHIGVANVFLDRLKKCKLLLQRLLAYLPDNILFPIGGRMTEDGKASIGFSEHQLCIGVDPSENMRIDDCYKIYYTEHSVSHADYSMCYDSAYSSSFKPVLSIKIEYNRLSISFMYSTPQGFKSVYSLPHIRQLSNDSFPIQIDININEKDEVIFSRFLKIFSHIVSVIQKGDHVEKIPVLMDILGIKN